jgi:uncharacterized protein with HEPN domain
VLRIEDMLLAAEEFLEFTKGLAFEQFQASPMAMRAESAALGAAPP